MIADQYRPRVARGLLTNTGQDGKGIADQSLKLVFLKEEEEEGGISLEEASVQNTRRAASRARRA